MDAVPLKQGVTGSFENFVDAVQKGSASEGYMFTFLSVVCKEVGICWCVIDVKVVLQGTEGISFGVLHSPVDIFSGRCCFRARESKYMDCVSSTICAHTHGCPGNVNGWIKSIFVFDREFSESGCAPECSGETGVYCGIERGG